MKTKQLTFLISLILLFMFSGISQAGMFSPDDWTECVFENIKNLENQVSVINTFKACQSKFPNKPIKGNSGIFGPNNYDDCILKYGKGVELPSASKLIQLACTFKFKNFTDEDKNGKLPEEPPTYEDCEILKDFKEEKSRHDELTAMGVDSPTPYIPLPEKLEKIDYSVCGKKFPRNFE